MLPRNQRGFTLIEIVIALAIIGLLIAAIVPIVIQQLEKGRRARVLTDLKTIGEASQQFFNDLSGWPKPCADTESCILYTSTSWEALGPAQFGADDVGLLQKRTLPAWDAAKNFGWNGPYIKSGQVADTAGAAVSSMSQMKDPWGNAYHYYYAAAGGGPAGQGMLVLWSAGPNRSNESNTSAAADVPTASGDDIIFIATTRLKP